MEGSSLSMPSSTIVRSTKVVVKLRQTILGLFFCQIEFEHERSDAHVMYSIHLFTSDRFRNTSYSANDRCSTRQKFFVGRNDADHKISIGSSQTNHRYCR